MRTKRKQNSGGRYQTASAYHINVSAVVLIAVILLLLLSSCGKNITTGGDISITDSMGNTLSFDSEPKRVVALQSSIADVWLLAGGSIVGISDDYEDYGLDVTGVTVIGETHYTNREYIAALYPDLVLYTAKHDKAVIAELMQLGIPCFGADIECFDDYLHVLDAFCTLTGHRENYTTYGTDVKTEIDGILSAVPENHVAGSFMLLRARRSSPPTVMSEHFVSDMLTELGAENIAQSNGNGNLTFSMEAVVDADPDVIFITYMGVSSVADSQRWLNTNILTDPAWQSLSAVRDGHVVFLFDEENLDRAHLYQYKPNARWAEAYKHLYEQLYPSQTE